MPEDKHRLLFALRRITVALAHVRGLRRLADFVRSRYATRSDVMRISDFDGDLKFDCHLDSHISSQIFWNGSYSRSQLRLLDRLLRPDHVFFDIGANEGEQTVFAAKRVPRGRVVAFEPSTEIRKRIAANVTSNGFMNVTLERVALSDQPGELPLYKSESRYSDGSFNAGQATLYARPNVATVEEVVPVTTLDAYLGGSPVSRLDVMKIDVEGAEYAVIRGARETIARYRPLIIVEVVEETSRAGGHPVAELLELIRAQRYTVHDIDRHGRIRRNRGRPTLDVLCVPDEKIAIV